MGFDCITIKCFSFNERRWISYHELCPVGISGQQKEETQRLASCQPHGDHQHEYKLNYASPVKIWSSLQQLLKLFNFGSVINRWISIFYNNDVESDSFMTSHFSVSRVVENMSNNRAFDLLNLQTQSNTIA